MKLVTNEVPDENPSGAFYREVATDALGFGGGALLTHVGLEYGTANYMSGVAPEQTKNTSLMLAGGKILGGVLVMGLTGRYYHEVDLVKKFFYGVGAGFFTSAGSDLVTALM